MNWLISMFLTKARIKGWIHDGIASAISAAKKGDPDKLAKFAGYGEDVSAATATLCKVGADGEYSDADRAEMDAHVDKLADGVLGLLK